MSRRPHLYLVENGHPIDLPDRYDGIDNHEIPPGAAIAFMLGGFVMRASGVTFWIALGLAAGLML